MEMCQYKIHKHHSFMERRLKFNLFPTFLSRWRKTKRKKKMKGNQRPSLPCPLSTSLFLTTQDKNKNNNTLYSPFLKKQLPSRHFLLPGSSSSMANFNNSLLSCLSSQQNFLLLLLLFLECPPP